jgi:hypothetical protein
MSTKKYRQQGPFAPPALPSFTATYGPIRHPHASAPLPGVAGYRNGLAPWISPRDVEGFSSCFTCPCHRATAVYPAGVDSRISQIRQPMLPSPKLRKLGLRISSISRPHYVHVCCGPVTRSPLYKRLCRRASSDWFPAHLSSKLRGSGSYPGRLYLPAEHVSLPWTH